MPSSRAHTIPVVLHCLQQLQPRSILDVGVGFGKWGHLFREYTDINASEHDPARYQRPHWQVRIDGIEGHAAYLTEMHRYLYDEIHIGNAVEVLPSLTEYDLIFMGDIIEHLDKEAGRDLLRVAREKARLAVLVTTPKFETGQTDSCDNPLERHRSLWAVRDFKSFPGARVRTLDRVTLVALLPRPGTVVPEWFAPSRKGVQGRERMTRALEALREAVPEEAPFILVDEEQLRSLLSHRKVFPFPEREGTYWGPPEDDAAALGSLQALRRRGARYMVFVWSTFWWLTRYPALARHLHEEGRLRRDDALLKIFELKPE